MTSTRSAASLTSLAWIFLPRYSGVRPTMRPPMNTAMIAKARIVYMPAPAPPGETSPSIIPVRGPMPPIGVNESLEPVTEPSRSGSTRCRRGSSERLRSGFLALHVAARELSGRLPLATAYRRAPRHTG